MTYVELDEVEKFVMDTVADRGPLGADDLVREAANQTQAEWRYSPNVISSVIWNLVSRGTLKVDGESRLAAA